MTEWKDVLQKIVQSLGTDQDGLACVLDFLKVLPEEVTEGRKITLTVRSTESYLDTRFVQFGTVY
jgi:transportin-3